MTKFVQIHLLILLASVVCLGQLTGKVVGISDGDTITVLDASKQQTRVRLAGIDAPESGQDFGNRAKQHLSSLVFGKQVVVVGSKIDRYGRLIGKVIINGRDANLDMVAAGFAWHYKQYQREQNPEDRKIYAAAEDAARTAQKGLWSMAGPVPPWDYRKGGR